MHFHRRNYVLFRVENEDIAEVVAESATIYVNFVLVGYWSMAPTGKESTIFHLSFSPSKVKHWTSLKEGSEIDWVDIAEASVLCITPCDYVKFVAVSNWWVESSCTRMRWRFIERDFGPAEGEEVEDPKIVEIANALTSKHNKIRVVKFRSVIRPLPRGILIGFRQDFHPFLGAPIQNIDTVVPFLIGAASSEHDDAIIPLIVAHWAIGPLRGYVSSCRDFLPFHGDGIEGPEIIHVGGI